MTDQQPEGTLLAAQLGDAVGGPGPDPETPLSDAEHRLGQVRRLGESWSMETGTRREDGVSLLAVLGDAAPPVAAVDPETVTEADLAEALDGFWLFVACGGQRVHGQVADPDEVASVLLATLGRIAAERSPDGTEMGSGGGYDVWGADFGHAGSPQDYWRRKAEPVVVTEHGPPVAAALERPTIDSEPSASDDTSRVPASAHGKPREHAGAVLAIDPADFRDLIGSALDGSIDLCARCKTCHEQVDAVMAVAWPLLEHAQFAAAGSHEGVRLWMLDCGELVAKHRTRAETAEGKLSAIAAELLRPHRELTPGTEAGFVRVADILAITGTEGGEGDG